MKIPDQILNTAIAGNCLVKDVCQQENLQISSADKSSFINFWEIRRDTAIEISDKQMDELCQNVINFAATAISPEVTLCVEPDKHITILFDADSGNTFVMHDGSQGPYGGSGSEKGTRF